MGDMGKELAELIAQADRDDESAAKVRPADDALHFSALKCMAKTPAHYRSYVDEGIDETRAMGKGTLVHALLLGGDFIVYDKTKTRSGKAWDAFKEEHKARRIVTQAELDEARRVADAVLRDRVAAPLLEGDKEREWTATMYGRKCAGRIDIAGRRVTADLKVTRDTEPGRFQRQALWSGFHAQLDWYSEARRVLGEDPGDAFVIGVEPKKPYAVTVLHLTPRALAEGRKLIRLWLERLAGCEAANEWPAYAQTAVRCDLVEDAGLIIGGQLVGLGGEDDDEGARAAE